MTRAMTPGTVASSLPYDQKRYSNKWLYHAIPFNAARVSAAPEVTGIVNDLFPHLLEIVKHSGTLSLSQIMKKKTRIKYACKVILFNLYLGWLQNMPVKYSRRSNDYIQNTRYRKLQFTYPIVISSINAFISLGLIYNKPGQHFPAEKNGCLQSRMWATEELSNRLLNATKKLPFQVKAKEKRELVILRDKNKLDVNYVDTIRTRKYRANLTLYNDFISNQLVEVQSDKNLQVSLGTLKEKLLPSFLQAAATLTTFSPDSHYSHGAANNTIAIANGSSNVPYVSLPEEGYHKKGMVKNGTSITDRFSKLGHYLKELIENNSWRKLPSFFNKSAPISSLSRENVIRLSHFRTIVLDQVIIHKRDMEYIYTKRPLLEHGISTLRFIIENKKLYRVFNRKKFTLGGRFYGAMHISIPKELRAEILINGEPTIELDYSAHHVRIPYHQTGIDYREDPYKAVCNNPGDENERKMVKHLFLILENTGSKRAAIGAFREHAKPWYWEYFDKSKGETVGRLIDKILYTHDGIRNYFHNDVGRKLQFADSEIAEAVLLRMTELDIPCLPVHDSFIVPEQCEKDLYNSMMEEYHKKLSFYPVIK